MLGFRSSKCKTSCKLCVSRIKLNKNKREIQLTHQRREIGELLKKGKNEYAWIRVEAVIREKNLIAAYEILELYLELIAVRVELLDKHRTCPRDMVEAITTLMFAAPRVADLPELIEVRKWLNIKFGRELGVEGGRNFDGTEPPNWQVNLRLRQYLAVEAPEPEDKLSMISSIAEEASVDFDLQSYAQSVMVQLDPMVTPGPPPPPIPQPPVFQQPSPPPPAVQTNGSYPRVNYGIVPPSAVTPTSPLTHEPNGDAPVLPPKQPSRRFPFGGPSSGPYTDAQIKMTGTSIDTVPDSAVPPPLPDKDSEYQRQQKQYDDVPTAPQKEAYHDEEEANEDGGPLLPSAPAVPPSDTDIDFDLSNRLAELRKR